jgi:hypothetical protein
VQRTRAWLVLGPVVVAGVLVGHGLAYRITGTAEGPEHDYLTHVPQVLLVLVVVGLAGAGLGARTRLPETWQLPATGMATFVAQEHLERLAHTGTVPFLLATPAFLVGLLLQIPIALLAWVLTRSVVEALVPIRTQRARPRRIAALLAVPEPLAAVGAGIGAPLPGRGPPLASRL